MAILEIRILGGCGHLGVMVGWLVMDTITILFITPFKAVLWGIPPSDYEKPPWYDCPKFKVFLMSRPACSHTIYFTRIFTST